MSNPSGALSHASDYVAYYVYDKWDNMVQSVSGDDIVDYAYDGVGLRYGKKVNNGSLTISLYEYDRVILEVTDGTQTAVNVYGNALISRNGEFFMNNGHGDVTAILSASGVVVASYYYDAFGVHTNVTGSSQNPYRYAGYLFDAETARFLSEDTYWMGGAFIAKIKS